MTYFAQFPYTTYEVLKDVSTVKDIFRRSTFISEYKPYTDLYTTYTINDGETAQSVALQFYGSAFYHWIVLVFNEMHNPYFDWPLTQHDVEVYCKATFGEELMFTVKQYERNGIVVGEYKDFVSVEIWTPPANPGPEDLSIVPVSFLEFYDRINEGKREIQLLRPELLGEFVRQFEESINE